MAETVFVDTSGIYALLVADDAAHAEAVASWARIRARRLPLVSTSYVLVELYALLGRRVGLDAIRSVRDEVARAAEIVWVDRAVHERGLDLLLERGSQDLSLVDATAFVVARDRQIEQAFAFDRHFRDEGLTLP